jgi:hypothetical protein
LLFSKQTRVPLQLIDHGFALTPSPRSGGEYPSYLRMYSSALGEDPGAPGGVRESPIHPAAAAWALSLNPEQFEKELDRNGTPQHYRDLMVHRLIQLQHDLKHVDGKMTRDAVRRTNVARYPGTSSTIWPKSKPIPARWAWMQDLVPAAEDNS